MEYLPNELLGVIGSYLYLEDHVRYGWTSKRIYLSLKIYSQRPRLTSFQGSYLRELLQQTGIKELRAPPNWGKKYLLFEYARYYSQTSVVVVNVNFFLMDEWKNKFPFPVGKYHLKIVTPGIYLDYGCKMYPDYCHVIYYTTSRIGFAKSALFCKDGQTKHQNPFGRYPELFIKALRCNPDLNSACLEILKSHTNVVVFGSTHNDKSSITMVEPYNILKTIQTEAILVLNSGNDVDYILACIKCVIRKNNPYPKVILYLLSKGPTFIKQRINHNLIEKVRELYAESTLKIFT